MTHRELTPFPDELAYSVLARILAQWDYSYNAELLREIVGTGAPTIDPVLPPTIEPLAKALGFASTRSFAAKHTLLPYYLAFAAPATRSHALRALEEPDASRRIRLLRNGQLTDLEPKTLRYCADCRHEDCVRHGQPYWHRAHQLPAVQRCPRHRCMLRWASVPYRTGARETMFITCVDATRVQATTRRCVPQMDAALGVGIEQRSVLALSTGLSVPHVRTARSYETTFKFFGYETIKGMVDRQSLAIDFVRFARAHRCAPDRLGYGQWWLSLHERRTRTRGLPVQHMLMEEFLDFLGAPTQMRLELVSAPPAEATLHPTQLGGL